MITNFRSRDENKSMKRKLQIDYMYCANEWILSWSQKIITVYLYCQIFRMSTVPDFPYRGGENHQDLYDSYQIRGTPQNRSKLQIQIKYWRKLMIVLKRPSWNNIILENFCNKKPRLKVQKRWVKSSGKVYEDFIYLNTIQIKR